MTDLVQTLIHDLGSRVAAHQYAVKVAQANGEDSAAYAEAAFEICEKCNGSGTHCPECRFYGPNGPICNPTKEMPEQCECQDWATLNVRNTLLTGHHENCSKRVIKPEQALLNLVSALVEGMNAWGQDCDGIHPDAWEAYVKANAVLLQALKHNVVD